MITVNIKAMSSRDLEQGIGAATYTIVGSFIGGAAGGAWLGLVLMSLTGLYGNIPLWKDLLAGVLAAAVVAALSVLCGRQAGLRAGLRVGLIVAFAALNVVAALYLFGAWVCEVSPAGPAFTNCRLPAPSGGLGPARSLLFFSPATLAAMAAALLTLREPKRS